jgi:hypothetical protein
MLSASTKIFLESLAALLVVLLLATGYGFWRLSEGPWSVPALAPYLAAALSDPASGRSVTLGETLLIWEPEASSVGIEIKDATFTGRDGATRARIADMSLRLSGLALLAGRIAPTEVAIIGPSVQLRRDADGNLALGLEPPEGTDAEPALSSPNQLADAWLSPSSRSVLASMRRLRLVGSTLTIDDRYLGTGWHASGLDVTIARNAANQPPGFSASAGLSLDIDGQPTALKLNAAYDLASDRLVSDGLVTKLDPARLAHQLAALKSLAAFEIALDANMHVVTNIAGDLEDARLSLSGTQGRLAHPALPAGGVSLDAFAAHLAYAGKEDRLRIEDLTAAIEHRPVLSATAEILHPFGEARIEGSARVVDLTPETLVKLWPVEIAPGGREWVAANITGGSVHAAEARFAAVRAPDDEPTMTSLDGSFDFSGLRVTYMPRMPAVEQISGTARIDLDRLLLTLQGGRTRGLAVTGGTIELSDFQRPLQQIGIDLPIKGPLPEILGLLNEPPLGYLARFGMAPATTEGTGDVRLRMKFPAIAKLSTQQIQLNAVADATGVKLPKLIRDNDLTEGSLHLDIDRNGLKAAGNAKLANTPVALKWSENFTRGAPFQRRIEATASADEAARRAFGIDAAPYVAGPVGVALTYVDIDGRRAELAGSVDFRPARLGVDFLGWAKPAGVAASGKFAMRLVESQITDLTQADYDGAGLTIQATGRMDKGTLASLDLHRLATRDSDLAGSLVRTNGGGWNARIRGSRFDGHSWFGGSGDSDDASFQPSFPLTLDVQIGRLLLDAGEVMGGVALSGRYDGTRWQQGSLSGHVGTGDVRMSLVPGAPARSLTLEAGDAGAFLKAVGLTAQVEGGTLKLTGTLDNRTPRLTAHIEAERYEVRRAGLFAQLLALISVTGIPNVMSGNGIAFQSFTGDLVRTPARTEITRAQASGLSIGLTAKGSISRPDGKLDLAGLIVPVNSVNRVIGAIPLLGDLLTGGPGGGLFAVSYRLGGTSEDPSITVNPLSALAPGALRTLLEQFVPTPSGSSSTPAPAAN